MVKGRKKQRVQYPARSTPRQRYQEFIKSPKADEPSEDVFFDNEDESGQVVPVTIAKGYLISSVPPAQRHESRFSGQDFLRTVFWVVGLVVLIGGILWGVFTVTHDVKEVRTSLNDIKNNEMREIRQKLEKQDELLERILHERETAKNPRNKKDR